MNAQTDLNTYTIDMLRFHPPRMWDRDGMGSRFFRKPASETTAIVVGWTHPQGREGMIQNLRVIAFNGLRPGYRKPLSWKTLNRKLLLKEALYYFLCYFRTILNSTTNQSPQYCYEDPIGDFFLQFHFFSDK